MLAFACFYVWIMNLQLPVHLFPIRTLFLLILFSIFRVLVFGPCNLLKCFCWWETEVRCIIPECFHWIVFGWHGDTCLFSMAYIFIMILFVCICCICMSIYAYQCYLRNMLYCYMLPCTIITHHGTFWRIVTCDIHTYPWPTLMFTLCSFNGSIYPTERNSPRTELRLI